MSESYWLSISDTCGLFHWLISTVFKLNKVELVQYRYTSINIMLPIFIVGSSDGVVYCPYKPFLLLVHFLEVW